MSYLSFVIVVLFGFMPPFELAARMYAGEIEPLRIFGVPLPVPVTLTLAWLGLWIIFRLAVTYARSKREIRQTADNRSWDDRLIEAQYPDFAMQAVPRLSAILGGLTLLLFLLATGLPDFQLTLLRLLLGKPELLTLIGLGLLAEFLRRLEVAARDEHLWLQRHRKRREMKPYISLSKDEMP